MAHRIASGGPSLRSFIRRREVLSLYREVVRTSRAVPNRTDRREALEFARSQFDVVRAEEDPARVSWLLAEGRVQLGWWKSNLGMAEGGR